MKKILLIFYFINFNFNFTFSQSPLAKAWDQRYGSLGWDELRTFRQTKDGGYILGGYSYAGIGGDKTQVNRDMVGYSADYWIIKTDAFGHIQWDKSFGGGDNDFLFSVQQCSDNGYLLGGHSVSGIGGDKTQASNGDFDYWIVKTDSLGNQQWDKDFGGTSEDYLYSIQQTSDNGYILSGYSNSGIGGDKTQASWGQSDFWIVKTDSLGNIQWDKDFGGTNVEMYGCIQQTNDGGYIVGGMSNSGIGGNKTQTVWGNFDYWIVKTDASGNIQWDRDFGGYGNDWLNSLQQTSDGGYILASRSESGYGGDKTQNLQGGFTDSDFWILKIDSLGNKNWDKSYGGTGIEDMFGNVFQTNDGGYLLGGNSFSNSSGDKTENNLGTAQGWFIKADSSGNKQWDETLLTLPDDKMPAYGIQCSDGCYVFAKPSFGGLAGDKSQLNRDVTNSTNDYWMIKLCDTTAKPIVAFSAPNNICPGTCIDFLNFTFNATTYQWNFPGATPDTSTTTNPTNICYATPGNYDVQLIAENAIGSDTLLFINYITVYPQPAPQSITQNGDTLFSIAGATSYQWFYNGNIINGATNYFYTATQSGDYNVVATDINACQVEAALFNVIANAQLLMSGEWSTAVSPNPAIDQLVIRNSILNEPAIKINIYNLLGELIMAVKQEPVSKEQKAIINVAMLPSSIYYIEITSGTKIYRSKFVKQ